MFFFFRKDKIFEKDVGEETANGEASILRPKTD